MKKVFLVSTLCLFLISGLSGVISNQDLTDLSNKRLEDAGLHHCCMAVEISYHEGSKVVLIAGGKHIFNISPHLTKEKFLEIVRNKIEQYGIDIGKFTPESTNMHVNYLHVIVGVVLVTVVFIGGILIILMPRLIRNEIVKKT